jgi:hypothetical protein
MMRSPQHRMLAQMLWDKERDLQLLLQPDHTLYVPGEGWWRAVCAAYGRKCHMPRITRTLRDVKLTIYASIVGDESHRRDMKEMFDVTYRAQLHNGLVSALASKGEQGRLDSSAMEGLYAFLHQVQKITNPAAIAPQSQVADELEQDMEALKDFFTSGTPLQITPLR